MGRLATVALDDGKVGVHLHPLKVEYQARTAWVDDELRVVVQDVVEVLTALLVGRVRWKVQLIVTRPKLCEQVIPKGGGRLGLDAPRGPGAVAGVLVHEYLGSYSPDALGKLLHRSARDGYLVGYGDALTLLLGDERREGVEVEVHPYPYRGALVELAWLDVAKAVEGEGERSAQGRLGVPVAVEQSGAVVCVKVRKRPCVILADVRVRVVRDGEQHPAPMLRQVHHSTLLIHDELLLDPRFAGVASV